MKKNKDEINNNPMFNLSKNMLNLGKNMMNFTNIFNTEVEVEKKEVRVV